ILMVFVFGLIHGFGLSTKLQEVSVVSEINLSLSQILSFNVGVEFGQIAVLIIVFPLLSIIRGQFFDKISKFLNRILVVSGVFLLVYQLVSYQLNQYFDDHIYHYHQNELKKNDGDHNHEEVHTHEENHNHDNDNPHSH
ncbi:MAG: HupE/UreJ family protein, partial [Flavobacteriales bacterium]